MKKWIFLVVSCLILTGCNKEKQNLVCSKTINDSENLVKNVVEAKFVDSNADTLWFKTETILADKYLDYIDTFEENINRVFEEYNNKNGITINSIKTDTSIIQNMTINIALLDEETKEKLGIANTYSKYSVIKKNLERKGYSCK